MPRPPESADKLLQLFNGQPDAKLQGGYVKLEQRAGQSRQRLVRFSQRLVSEQEMIA